MADFHHHNTKDQENQVDRIRKAEGKQSPAKVLSKSMMPPALQLVASKPNEQVQEEPSEYTNDPKKLKPFQLKILDKSKTQKNIPPFKIQGGIQTPSPSTQLKPFQPKEATTVEESETTLKDPGAFSPENLDTEAINPAAAFQVEAPETTTPGLENAKATDSPVGETAEGEKTVQPQVDVEGMADKKAEEKKSEDTEAAEGGGSENPTADAAAAPPAAPSESGPPTAFPGGAAGASMAAIPAAAAPANNKLSNSKAGQMANTFFSSPASKLASSGIPNVGKDFNQAFSEDRKTLSDQTPPISGEIETASIPKAGPPPSAPPTKAATMPQWKAPASKIKKKDAPRFNPSGAANPQLVDQQAEGEQQKVLQDQQKAAQGISGLPGEDRVQGQDMEAIKEMALNASATTPDIGMTPEMETYLQMPMSESFRSQVDLAAQPNFDENMAGAQAQISEAIERRDQEQADAIAKTQEEAAAMSAKAQAEQEQTISQSRDAIQAEKEKGMAESQAVLENYQKEVGTAKDKQLKQIEHRISSDEQKVQTKFDQADKKVKQEEKNAEKEKEEAKKKKKKKKKKRKWWQKIGDAIASAVDSIAEAVSKIADTLKKVVKGIIEAAQKFANSIIDAARNFVVNAIQAFAKIAKGFLNVALAAFPGIRDRVNSFIDEAVNKTIQAVDMIANKLKEGVNYLAENLNKIVDFVANFYETIIQGGLAMLKAVATGNFADLPKIAFMTACNALGLPGEEFWGILMKAKDEALNIVKDPIGFLKNLIGAGKEGFGQFMSNVGKHLEKGLFGWLFGQLAATGIQLPDKFDAAGIFDLVRQVLGFTWDYVRGRIVGIIGEENMERIETVAGYFQMLFTEGPMAVYNELKDKLSAIKPTIVKEIQSWVISKVIQKAVMKIMSMLIPGAGFVQAIWGMWQSLQFFIEKIHDIADLVNTILDSIGLIAKGSIGPAANYVEKTMVKTLPIVFAFLAKLIGLGGIGAKIAKIIDKLRTPVNKAIDGVVGGMAKGGKSLLNKAKAGAKKGWNKVKSGAKKGWNKTKAGVKAGVGKVKAGVTTVKENVTEWWKKRRKFKTKRGETHELYFKGNSEKAVPMVASSPMTVAARLKKWRAQITPDAAPEVKAASSLISQAEQLISNDKDSPKLSRILKQLFDIFGAEAGGNPESMSPDEKKEGAKNKFLSIMRAKKDMSKVEIDKVLVDLKKEFNLTNIEFDNNPLKPEVKFYASPATVLPLVKNLAGQEIEEFPAGDNRIESGLIPGATPPSGLQGSDYVISVLHDGGFPSPIEELVSQLNTHFANVSIGSSAGPTTFPTKRSRGNYIGEIYKNELANRLPYKIPNNLYKRPGKVKARSSVPRQGIRPPNLKTETYGHLGVAEEIILTGDDPVIYRGGHLIGDQIMDGSKFDLLKDWNLAPQTVDFNHPLYENSIEKPLAKAQNTPANISVEYEVEVKYPDRNYTIQASRLLDNIFPATHPYRVQVENYLTTNGIDPQFTFTRRTPGFWQATAEIFGGTLETHNKVNKVKNANYTNAPNSLQDNQNYAPTNPSEVKYTIEIAGANAKWKTYNRGNKYSDDGGISTRGGFSTHSVGPQDGKGIRYEGAKKVRITARQTTF